MTASPLFSVIVPTHERPQYLPEALQSLLAQTIDDFECIIVDDASRNPAKTKLADPRIRMIRHQRNAGPAAARNTGLLHARGRYITFLDDDDFYTPDRLAYALDGLSRAPVSICWQRYADGPLRRPRQLEGDVRDTILDDTAPSLGATALRRESAPLFDDAYRACEDLEWWLRVSSTADVTTVPEVGYLVRRHEGNRHLSGTDARIEASHRLLSTRREYFATHRRAAAFRWRRIGVMCAGLRDYTSARRALAKAFMLHPDSRVMWRLLMSLRLSQTSSDRPLLHDHSR